MASKQLQGQNWQFLVYPDSASDNWETILRDMHIPFVISPLHDRDLYETDIYKDGELLHSAGDLKKPHYHVLVFCGSNYTWNGFKTNFVDPVRGVLSPIPYESKILHKTLACRYLIHLDDKDKAQYDYKDIRIFYISSDDFNEMFNDEDVKYYYLRDMFAFIRKNNVKSYARFVDWCALNNNDWFEEASVRSSRSLTEYIKSNAYSQEHNLEDEVTWQFWD